VTTALRSAAGRSAARPRKPRPSPFGLGVGVVAIALTVVTAFDWRFGTGLTFRGFIDNFGGRNSVIAAIPRADLDQMFSARDRGAFLDTVGIAVISSVAGTLVALPLALWSTRLGAPYRWVEVTARGIGSVIRSFPDVLWALIFVAAVGVGALPGVLALFFFSIAVITKLTADTVDGIDTGPLEAADASGSGHTQKLRTAVVPQILPAYASFALYAFELNLRASVVVGIVGGGGIGSRLEFFRNNYPGADRWEKVWGLVVMFVIVVFIIDRVSIALRRRLV